ncbi:MAG: penicillin-binding transpeptidase domain-containing protein, partial [Thermoanaerobaculia bacterium]|nr:penicillin-binding transpeptidase domain-containing protein [Thermoanaerobaculia bacterium]
SVALGASEVTPEELLSVYATLAAGGVRRPLHLLRGVVDATGAAVPGAALAEPVRVMGAEQAYVLTRLLEGVVDRGTASSARRLGFTAAVAGKTGTSNEARDNWFVGYTAERATLVWVGFDDGRATGLSGARGALPVWVDYERRLGDGDRARPSAPPRGLEWVTIDPVSGGRITDACPDSLREVFVAGTAPRDACHLHGRGHRRRRPARLEDPLEPPRKRRWWRRIFGSGQGAAFLPAFGSDR